MVKKDKDVTNQFNTLSEDELDLVAGGGYYFPVNGCEHGKTKLVEYLLAGVHWEAECMSCPHRKQKTKTTGGKGGQVTNTYWTCTKLGDRTWEW